MTYKYLITLVIIKIFDKKKYEKCIITDIEQNVAELKKTVNCKN